MCSRGGPVPLLCHWCSVILKRKKGTNVFCNFFTSYLHYLLMWLLVKWWMLGSEILWLYKLVTFSVISSMNYGHDLLYLAYIYLFVLDFFTGSDSIQGTWCKDILQTIMSFTPHNWASHTLSCFPGPLQVILFWIIYWMYSIWNQSSHLLCYSGEFWWHPKNISFYFSFCKSLLLLPKSLELFLVLLKERTCL